jgi:hypothetical protein
MDAHRDLKAKCFLHAVPPPMAHEPAGRGVAEYCALRYPRGVVADPARFDLARDVVRHHRRLGCVRPQERRSGPEDLFDECVQLGRVLRVELRPERELVPASAVKERVEDGTHEDD